MASKDFILFNPVSIVHLRNIKLFEDRLKEWDIRCILNPKFSWFSNKDDIKYDHFYFTNNRVPKEAFDGVKAIVVFSAQPRLSPCHLIQEAALRSIPVIAIEEVYQMMLEQGYVNEYFLPVDHLFVNSDYEREKMLEFGVPSDVVKTTGCMFNYTATLPNDVIQKDSLKSKLGLSNNKRIATLSLAYQTPSGETLDIRKKLITTVYEGLPENYELLVKPHPAEQDENLEGFIKNYAPQAKVADKYMPIGDVLSITDVLFNRGTSQVIINALKNNIPVAVVPTGRKTFFHDFLDELIVNDRSDVGRVMGVIAKKGFSVYDQIFKHYLSITPDAAVGTIMPLIDKIARDGDVHKTEDRLAEISLYWAFMGYNGESLRILSNIEGSKNANGLPLTEMYNLIFYRADSDTLTSLRRWANSGHRGWLIKSLWIKTLYMKNRRLSEQDKEWLDDFPPRMNREYFVMYASMLCWCYLKAGMKADCEQLLDRLYDEYAFLRHVSVIKNSIDSGKRPYSDFGYWRTKLSYLVNSALRNFTWEYNRLQ